MEKEYNVILKKGVDYTAFGKDMITITNKDGVPNREISVANERLGSYRQTHYYLTDEEAEIVKNHPDVLTVEIPPQDRDDIQITPFGRQSGNFTKNAGTTENHINYALLRSKALQNNYGTSDTLSDDYLYNLDGTGVDIVVQDTGIEPNHPEWLDDKGNSRLQQIDWASVSGLSFSQNANHYRDYHGHGTHVGSTIAGKHFGWAKNAKIYALKVSGLEGTGDEGTGISVTYAFDAIKLWHRNKPVDPKTGFKRPTVVNMSWGYGLSYNSVSSMTYRGTTYTDSTISTANDRWSNYGLVNYVRNGTFVTNIRVASVDTDIEELVDEGVHVVVAAGNRSHKVDIVGGDDYNNYFTIGGTDYYYHRGSSPQGGGSILVGSLDSGSYDATNDQASTYTEKGAGVDIYAHGTRIMAASSNVNIIGGYTYFYDNSYKQVAISGTSMAAPQVSGVMTLMLQANPNATPSELKTSLLNNCGNVLYDTASDTDYTNLRSLLGSEKRILFNKFGQKADCFEVSGTFDIPLTLSF